MKLRRDFICGSLLWALVLSSCLVSGCSSATAATGSLRQSLYGAWQDKHDPDYRVSFTDLKLVTAFQGQVRTVATILDSTGSLLRLCEKGRDSFREVSFDGDGLVLRDLNTGAVQQLRRLGSTPPELMLKPLPIPHLVPVSERRVEEIQAQLWARFQRDQEVLRFRHGNRPPKDQPWLAPPYDPMSSWGAPEQIEQIQVLSENTRYLKETVSEVGWIDVGRFGYGASNAAFFLAQHSGDLPLMLAVLPWIKADVDAEKTEGEVYALLYDRLQLYSGEKQLYGSQVDRDEKGESMLFPLEDPSHLDERRAVLKMTSIAEYMRLFGTKQIRISTACSPASSHAAKSKPGLPRARKR